MTVITASVYGNRVQLFISGSKMHGQATVLIGRHILTLVGQVNQGKEVALELKGNLRPVKPQPAFLSYFDVCL